MKKLIATCDICSKQFPYSPCILDGKELNFKPGCCRECDESKEEREKTERVTQKLLALQKRWEERCPPLYRETDPSRLDQSGLNKVLAWLPSSSGRGLLIGGDTGKGKTRSMWLLLKRLHFEDETKFMAITETGFANDLGSAFASGPHAGSKYINDLCNTPVLFIDDLGKASTTSRSAMEYFHLIEERTRYKRPILATLNDSSEELATQLGRVGNPIVRRLRDYCDQVKF